MLPKVDVQLPVQYDGDGGVNVSVGDSVQLLSC